MKKYRIVFPLLLSCILWYSCTDWLDYKPSDKQSEEQQFSSKDGFYAAVNGVYNRMSGNSLYGKYLSYDMIDILGQYYAVEQSDESDYYKYLRALTEWDYSNESVTGVLSSIWNEAYSTIMNTNVVLKNIEDDAVKDKVLPEREYKMLKGEMLAVRAMLHLDMLRLFGPIMAKNPDGRGIPYNESTDPQILSIMPAGTVLKDYIIRDLTEAEALLLASDPVLTEGPRAEYDEVSQDNSMRYRQLRLNYYATVLLTARAYLWGGDAIARDITQDTFIRLYERRRDFDVPEKAKSFIYITARNLCLDHLKHQKIKQQYQQTQSVSKAEDPDFLHEITYQETLRILHQAIDTLPPQTRKIILLGLNGKNNNEIAETLNISVNTVKSLKKSAYTSLREQLKDPMLFLLFLLIG